MRDATRDFTQLCADTLTLNSPIYEFGALQVEGNPELSDLRPLFGGKTFVGCDMRPGPGVDKVLNLHDVDLPNETAGTVISLDTLEHVEYPREAVKEIHRILKPDGVAILTSVLQFPIHGYPNDFWRFTPEGFKSLLRPFQNSIVGGCAGTEDFPQTIIGIGFKGDYPDLTAYNEQYEKWSKWLNQVSAKLREHERNKLP
jgi:SAM-dependent methyltransferase